MVRPDYWKGCTPECERVVYCTTCGRRKQPIGRDAPMECCYCDSDGRTVAPQVAVRKGETMERKKRSRRPAWLRDSVEFGRDVAAVVAARVQAQPGRLPWGLTEDELLHGYGATAGVDLLELAREAAKGGA